MTIRVTGIHQADIRLILQARALRGFGDGFAVLILPSYLSGLGYTPAQIGLVATASLLGSSLLTLAIGLVAPRFDLRHLLLLGAAIIVLTGLALPNVQHYALILAISFFGSVSATDGDRGMLVPLEHARLTEETEARERTNVFARYSLVGALAAAAGALGAGLPDALAALGLERTDALRTMFYIYAAIGFAAAMLYRKLPPNPPRQAAQHAPLHESKSTVYKLAALFSVDSFAGGFAVQSLIALWLFEQFDMSLSSASVFFFWTGLASAFSFPVAAKIASRIGLINTMVFTHIPSSLCLIAAALAPSLPIVLTLLIVRAFLSQMDVPTRSSYVMAVVTPSERPAAASLTAVPRGIAASISPALSGVLMSSGFAALPLIICGSLKIAYDLALLALFRRVKPPEEAN